MGRTEVEFTLTNYADMKKLEDGRITASEVRRMILKGIVDTGAARLVLPQSAVDFLGLPLIGTSSVRYADHHREMRDIVNDAYVEMNNRGGMFKAIVEPKRTDAFLGAIVMEDLDLLVDCVAQKVYPRDPNTIITEVE